MNALEETRTPYSCPNCKAPLARKQADHGIFWVCPSCGGRAIGVGFLRKSISNEYITALWVAAREGHGVQHRPCPVCAKAMIEVTPPLDGASGPTLDVCKVCQFVWFDSREYDKMPVVPHQPEPDLPPAVREMMAIEAVTRIAEEGRTAGQSDAPDEWWKFIAGLFGLPVEYDAAPPEQPPWATWGLAAVIALVSVVAFSHLAETVKLLGLVPAEASRYGGVTLLTSFFIHGGIIHLAGNLYFLLVFGDNVEDCLGKWKYLLLIFLATLAGDMLHIVQDPHKQIPVIGASGGISGIVAFYALRFPKVRLQFLFRMGWYFRWFQLPVYVFFILWILFQFLGARAQIAGSSQVSALAHLGGAAVGYLFYVGKRFAET